VGVYQIRGRHDHAAVVDCVPVAHRTDETRAAGAADLRFTLLYGVLFYVVSVDHDVPVVAGHAVYSLRPEGGLEEYRPGTTRQVF